MRGTCSAGFTLRATGEAGQVLPVPYETIHAQSMVPTAHILWSSAWAGVAAAAVERARRYVRKAARNGETPPSAAYFTRANASLRALRALIATSLARYEAIADDPEALAAMDFQSQIALLKVDASELAVQAVMSALRCCGLSGYRNDSDVSIGRHLRDVLFLADHDQQRPHPRQRRRVRAAGRGRRFHQGLSSWAPCRNSPLAPPAGSMS